MEVKLNPYRRFVHFCDLRSGFISIVIADIRTSG